MSTPAPLPPLTALTSSSLLTIPVDTAALLSLYTTLCWWTVRISLILSILCLLPGLTWILYDIVLWGFRSVKSAVERGTPVPPLTPMTPVSPMMMTGRREKLEKGEKKKLERVRRRGGGGNGGGDGEGRVRCVLGDDSGEGGGGAEGTVHTSTFRLCDFLIPVLGLWSCCCFCFC
ncbi:hypothetical protein EX30DRAFT_261450 [Ascodesmis nigricans]|uniref:Uncharacterized protein n=1 Tax=Ascodesmis nigricans TaxID=341454 RepID=A0A4S2MXH1_9PEZI|nr:hypothetical protein EX30DRAFT_261450 [Ascodesmis nigricans]